jgi:hypothetical protein
MKGLDFGEIFAHVAHLEVIMILLAFDASKRFKLYQMDVKNNLLHNIIQEGVFVKQPQILRMSNILIECTNFQRICVGKDGRIDAIGCIRPCYPYFIIFIVLVPRGIVVF